MSRPSLSVLAAAVVLAAGLVGVVRGAQPQSSAASSSGDDMANMSTGMTGMSLDMAIKVTGAYVRQPANKVNAAVYFTVNNAGDTTDTLVSVVSGAGAQATVHTEDASGGMRMTPSGGLQVPAHGSLALTPGKGHVMIEQLYGPVLAGQTVNLELTFAQHGAVVVTAPVIGVTAPAPVPSGTSTP